MNRGLVSLITQRSEICVVSRSVHDAMILALQLETIEKKETWTQA
jgi:hypothetical protein